MPPALLSGLGTIADRYGVLFCDIWGVIHNGERHFPAAVEALSRFKAESGTVVLISNSPRPADGLIGQLSALGVTDAAYSAVVSSGDATRAYLRDFAPSGSAYVIGPERDAHLYTNIEIDLSGTPGTAAFISCTGLFDDENEVPEQYRDRLAACAARGLTLICANPDRVVQRGDRIIYCAGSLADLYVELGGKVIMAGKPYAPIYDLCYRAVESLTGNAPERSRILAIGDGLPTDVLGANAQGLDLVFVAAGIHAVEATGDDGVLDPLRLQALLEKENASASYVAPALAW